jgi:hypothetical protein
VLGVVPAQSTVCRACSCAGRDSRSRPVMQAVIPDVRDPNQTARRAGVILCRSGSRMRSTIQNNGSGCRTRLCSRPLRARDRWHFDSHCGALAAADRQPVRPPFALPISIIYGMHWKSGAISSLLVWDKAIRRVANRRIMGVLNPRQGRAPFRARHTLDAHAV